MRWFRLHIRIGSRLALFALALQLVLTFGHVHLDGLTPSAHALRSAVANHFTASLLNPADPSGSPQGTADSDCPICALIQLASTSAPSVAPPLPVPLMLGGVKLEAPNELQWAPSPQFAFQARAPPSI
jgi:hypothetical protein